MVGDEREVPAQFDHTGQLAPVLAGLADRKGGCFIDDEHGRSLDPSAWQEQAGVQNATCNADRTLCRHTVPLRGGFQNFRASLGATISMHAAWSKLSTVKPSLS